MVRRRAVSKDVSGRATEQQASRPHANSDGAEGPSSLRATGDSEVSDTADVPPFAELLRPNFRRRLKERMRKRDVTLGIMIGLVAALCAGVDRARQSDLEFYDLPAFTLPTFGFGSAVRRPGIVAAEQGLRAHHPIFIIPGFTTTGLEVWEGNPCAKRYFRQRMWGTLTMARTFIANRDCWFQHLKLDPATGMDPPGIKLRAAQGLEAVDYVLPGYNVWGEMIESLADIGYDSNMLYSASYDWRLSLHKLEERDGYFTKLQSNMELSLRVHGQKAAVLSHSFGDTVFRYFLSWVSSPLGGNAGPGWAEQHVAEYVVIAGAMLGTPKVLAGLISGEIRDTAEMQGLQQYLTSTVVPHSSRTALWRSWGSLLSLIPFGDERIWGNATYAPDLPDSAGVTIMMEAPASAIEAVGYEQSTPTRPLVHAGNLTLEQTMKFLFSESIGGVDLQAKLAEHSFGADPEGRLLHAHDLEPRHWANPLEARLPNAPSLRIYSLYGIGIPTERAYFYTPTRGEESDVPVPVTKTARTSPQEEETLKWGDYAEAMKPKVLIDKTVHREPGAAGTTVKSGVLTTDGDGTVPLISLGYMCVKGWKEKRFNPAGITCVTREREHNPQAMSFQGGPNTGDHVDIMGNHDVIADVLKVVAGQGRTLEDRIVSNLHQIVARTNL